MGEVVAFPGEASTADDAPTPCPVCAGHDVVVLDRTTASLIASLIDGEGRRWAFSHERADDMVRWMMRGDYTL